MLLGVTATVSTLVGVAIPFVSDHQVQCARCVNRTNPCDGMYFVHTSTGDHNSNNNENVKLDYGSAAAAAGLFGVGNSSNRNGGGSAGTSTSYACPSFGSHSGFGGSGSSISTSNVRGTTFPETSFGPLEAYSSAGGLLLPNSSNCSFGPGTANAGFAPCSMEESHASWRTVFWVPVGLSLFGVVGYVWAGSGELQEWNSPSYRGLIHKASKAQWKTILSNV